MTDIGTRTRCQALVAGFGRPGMRDLDFGRQLVRYLEQQAWPEGVVVEDLSYAAPLVLHRLRELEPTKVVLIGAVARGAGLPGDVRRYQLDPAAPSPDEVARCAGESAQGIVDIDHTLAVARHWGGLPADTVVIEVEPADCSFGLGFSEELGAAIDQLVGLLRAELGIGVVPEPDLDGAWLAAAAPGAPADAEPAAPDPAAEPCDGLVALAQRAREHARRLVVPPRQQPPAVARALDESGLVVVERSRPWAIGLDRGSDWNDVVPLPEGWFSLVVGDAPGRGVEAVAVMEELRAATRAYAVLEGRQPARVLAHLDRLVRATGVGEGAAVVCLAVNPATGEVRIANAGHCPPLAVGAECDGCFLTGGRSGPLGAAALPVARAEVAYTLSPASTVILFTDGLVQSRTVRLRDGLRRLRCAVAEGPAALDDLCDHVVDACTADLGRDDDLSVMAVRLPWRSGAGGGRPTR